MEPHNYHSLLSSSVFSLIMIFNYAHAICVPRNSTNFGASPSQPPAPSPSTAPIPASAPRCASNPPSKSAIPLLPDPAVEKICNSTDYPDICISAITPFLNGKTDVVSVLEIAIKAAVEHTKLAVSIATEMSLSPATPPQMASILSDCKDSYNDALDNFQSAMDALPGRDVGTMNSMLSAAITDFSDCDDELSGQSPPLLDLDTTLSRMASNCLAIVSLVQ